ncbi:MAG: hypothetical protein ABF743_04130 [Schleiferilactobacillus perolens]
MRLSCGNNTARWFSALMLLGVFETAHFAGSNRRHSVLASVSRRLRSTWHGIRGDYCRNPF